MVDAVLFDVDGTLVDTNYHHAIAWYRAFQRHDITPALWRIHRAIGMGGDQLVSAVAGEAAENTYGDDLRDAWTEEFDALIDEVRPFDGAEDLLREVRRRGAEVVLASSGESKHVEHYLDLINGRELAAAWTTSDDAEQTKPAPDLVETAMAKVDADAAVMIGDSVWDAKAGQRAGVATYALRTGGFSVEELEEAGAVKVYESLEDIQADLDTVLRRP